MDRSHARLVGTYGTLALLLGAALLISTNGCASLLATGVYLWDGGNLAPADCNALKGHRVVVLCKPPASNEYRNAGASRSIAKQVSELLVKHVKNIDVVNPREVDKWVDESDWGDFRELAQAVHADFVVHIELDDFDLFKGKTLYQGRADVTVSVYDVKNHNHLVWDRHLGEILYPVNSGIPAQDKPVQQFEREFVEIVADKIATNFYRHDPNADFAIDATANR
ncbi:MAG TPA: hypothetical protein VHE81_10645 [Lacipirellulaceae bacterium]|nr:hypothetical protein [Lacipirellulaceae bacterium]